MDNEIRNHVRLTLVKLREYNTMGETYEVTLRKMAGASDNVDVLASKLIDLETRNDYQHLIIMTFIN